MKKILVSILLCVSMVSAMVAGCGSSSSDEKKEDTKTEDTEKKDDAKGDAASGEDTLFTQAMAQVDEDFAPLPKKDSGVKLAAIESTLASNACFVLLFFIVLHSCYIEFFRLFGSCRTRSE